MAQVTTPRRSPLPASARELIPRGRRRRLRPEERREQLINAAISLYSARSVDQVSVDDITAAADVSRALFYRYFSSTEELFQAATATALDGLIARFRTVYEGSLVEQLRHALHEFVLFAEEHRATFAALLRNGSVMATPDTDALIDQVRHVAVEEIMQRTGVTDPSPMTLMTLRAWIATVEVATLSWLQEQHLTADELVVWLTDQLVGMMAATAAHDPSLDKLIDTLDLA